jgi:hypothetical protein
MQVGGLDLDLFVVTSASASLEAFFPFLQSMGPAKVVVVETFRFVNGTMATSNGAAGDDSNSDESGSGWAIHEKEQRSKRAALRAHGVSTTLDVTFNSRGFPMNRSYFEAEKYDSYLIQHWQMQKCRELVLEEEKRGGFEYVRLGRLRPDLLVWPTGPTAELHFECFKANEYAQSPTIDCLAKARALWRKGVRATDERLSRRYTKHADHIGDKAWYHKLGLDLGMFGSRDLMVNKVWTGLAWLHAHRHHR